MFTVRTIAREFSLDLTALKQHIEDNYGLKILSPLENVLKGDMNINFCLNTSAGKKIVRFYGVISDFTEPELQIMEFLADNHFPTSRPLNNVENRSITTYRDYRYSVFDFIAGNRPLFTAEAFFRIGQSVARLQALLKDCPVRLNRVNRYVEIYRRKEQLANYIEQNLEVAKEILRPEVFATVPEQILLLREANMAEMDTQLIHGDIYSSNVIDDGHTAAIIDFEWVAQGPAIIDPLLYVAWEGVSNSRAKNTPAVYSSKPYLLTDQIQAYLDGFKTAGGSVRALKDPAILPLLVFLNIGDNLFNLEVAIKAKVNLFQDYMNSYNSATIIRKNSKELQRVLAAVAD